MSISRGSSGLNYDAGDYFPCLSLKCVLGPEERAVTARIETLIVAGWTGRDFASMEAHIRELEKIGVARPRTTPMFYRVGAGLLTTGESIQVAGGNSSGEAEVVIFCLEDGLWIGVGSDHTDRKLETVSVTFSKQVCPKPVGATLWPLPMLTDHWDELILRCHIVVDGERLLYQEDSVASLLHPKDLITRYRGQGHSFGPGSVMFGGTVPVKGALQPSSRVELELEDPVLKRALRHSYSIETLPVVD